MGHPFLKPSWRSLYDSQASLWDIKFRWRGWCTSINLCHFYQLRQNRAAPDARWAWQWDKFMFRLWDQWTELMFQSIASLLPWVLTLDITDESVHASSLIFLYLTFQVASAGYRLFTKPISILRELLYQMSQSVIVCVLCSPSQYSSWQLEGKAWSVGRRGAECKIQRTKNMRRHFFFLFDGLLFDFLKFYLIYLFFWVSAFWPCLLNAF